MSEKAKELLVTGLTLAVLFTLGFTLRIQELTIEQPQIEIQYGKIDWQNATDEEKLIYSDFYTRHIIANSNFNGSALIMASNLERCIDGYMLTQDLDLEDVTKQCISEATE